MHGPSVSRLPTLRRLQNIRPTEGQHTRWSGRALESGSRLAAASFSRAGQGLRVVV